MAAEKMARIGIAGISIECCTFSPIGTRYEDFTHYRAGEVLTRFPFLRSFEDHEIIPLQWSRGLPGGVVEYEAYEKIKGEILASIRRSAPLDALYLIMHGAMYVRGMVDAEGEFLSALRNSVGEDCLIGASYDLHGNISDSVFRLVDINTAYRKAPHTDAEETRERGFRLLCGVLSTGLRPHKAWMPVPMALPGEVTGTDWEPGRSVYAKLEKANDLPGILDASICIGYVWADEKRSGASVLAYGYDDKMVERVCGDLASELWEARKQFKFGVETGQAQECIGWAMQDKIHPVVISDSGDNPTAGGVGDVTHTLEHLLKVNPANSVFASIADKAAVGQCREAGIGAAVTLGIGGKLDTVHGKEIRVTGEVLTVVEDDGRLSGNGGQYQVVLAAGGVRIILTEKRTPFHYLRQFEALGITPSRCSILVVKIGYLVPELQQAAAKAYLALSPGAVSQDILRLPFKHLTRPIFPLDPDAQFSPSSSLVALPPGAGKR